MQQPPWMSFAWADLGQHEISGAGTNPKIAAYFRRAGHPEISDDETPWCAAFVGACLESAGLTSSRSLAARSYLGWGVGTAEPSIGAVTVLARGGDPSLGHVGFLVGATQNCVVLLGGNQSDAVTVAAFDRSRVLGFRLPAPANVVPRQPQPTQPSPTPQRTQAKTDPAGFEAALAHVLEFEGGWSDDPFDPGGATNKGITIGEFARERGSEVTSDTIGRLKAELHAIPDAEVRRIYLERYWRPAACDSLPPALAFFHFDAAVNQGVGGAARMLQEALGVAIDGAIGPATLGAAHAVDPAGTVERYADIRRRRYRALSHFWRFGRGWLRRVDATASTALALARKSHPAVLPTPSSPVTDPLPMPEIAHDLPTSEAPPAPAAKPAKWWGESMTIWGALLTAAATVAPAVFAAFGIEIPAELLQTLGQQLVSAAQAFGGLAGTVLTIVGRFRATQSIERRALSVRV